MGEGVAFRLDPEVTCEWGWRFKADTSVHPPVVSRVHVEFVGWLGDDIAQTFPVYVVTERLARALTEARLTGFELADARVTLDPQFVDMDPEQASALPKIWRWLKPVGRPQIDDIWADGRAQLHVSQRALDVMRHFSLEACDIEAVEA